MGFLDRLLGRDTTSGSAGSDHGSAWGSPATSPRQAGRPRSERPATDEQAIERYRYLLRTAPPEQIEQAHSEAFATLTPQQRRAVLDELSQDLPPAERPISDDPQQLARAATRAELRNPGTLERSFSRNGGMGGMGGMGMGGMLAGGLLAGVAGAFVATAVADAMFDSGPGDGGLFDTGGDAEAAGDSGDPGGDYGDAGGGGFGGDFGGDFGGGDF